MCMAVLVLEFFYAPGSHAPILLEPILAKLEGRRYVGPILLASLEDLVHKTRGRGGSSSSSSSSIDGGNSSGGATAKKIKASPTGWGRGCRCVTMRTCPSCLFGTGRTRVPPWRGRSYRPYMVPFFERTGTCVGCAGRTASGNDHMPLPLPP